MANEPDRSERIDALSSLRDLLVEEHAALKARDHDAILSCAQRKAARAGELKDLLPSRRVLDTIAALERAGIVELAAECDRLNRANGVLVTVMRGVLDRALGILRGTEIEQSSTVYGPGGIRRDTPTGRYAGSA